MTVRPTDNTLVSGFDPISHSISLQSCTTASSAETELFLVYLRIESFTLAEEQNCVGQILQARRSSETDL